MLTSATEPTPTTMNCAVSSSAQSFNHHHHYQIASIDRNRQEFKILEQQSSCSLVSHVRGERALQKFAFAMARAFSTFQLKRIGFDVQYLLKNGVTKVGRHSDCDIIIASHLASRVHCEIQITGDAVAIADDRVSIVQVVFSLSCRLFVLLFVLKHIHPCISVSISLPVGERNVHQPGAHGGVAATTVRW